MVAGDPELSSLNETIMLYDFISFWKVTLRLSTFSQG